MKAADKIIQHVGQYMEPGDVERIVAGPLPGDPPTPKHKNTPISFAQALNDMQDLIAGEMAKQLQASMLGGLGGVGSLLGDPVIPAQRIGKKQRADAWMMGQVLKGGRIVKLGNEP